MYPKLVSSCLLSAVLLAAAPAFALDPEPEPNLRFELTLGAGAAGIDTFRSTEPAFVLNPKVVVCFYPERWWCKLGIRLVRIPPRPDPWKKIVLIRIPPIGPGPDPGPAPIILNGDDLRIGATTIFAPELEVSLGGTDRFHPSISLGAGFSAEEGASKEVAGLGRFRTSRSNSPLVSYGVAGSYDLSNRVALRLEAQALTSFADSMLVEGPQGQTFRSDGGVTTTILTTVGVSFRF